MRLTTSQEIPPGASVVANTDAEGRARAYVRSGSIAGTARVRIAAFSLGYELMTEVTVKPGAPAGVRVLPRDTAIVLGSSFETRASFVDRRGNLRPDPIPLRATAPLAVSGRAISATDYGRGVYTAESGTWSDTGWVSVVPDGSLVGVHLEEGVLQMRTDGSDLRRLVSPPPQPEGWVAVAASGAIAFSTGFSTGRQIFVREPDGNVRPASLVQPGADAEACQYSPDGTFLYFNFGNNDYRLARVRTDGTGFEAVPGLENVYALHPSVSIGGRLVYRGFAALALRELANGATSILPFNGWSARWSPDALLIAYLADETRALFVTTPDGGSNRLLSAMGAYAWSIDWSPDSRWIAASNSTTKVVDLVQVSTGLTIPLPFTRDWRGVSWRPR